MQAYASKYLTEKAFGRNRSTKKEPREPEQNITHMEASLYKAAAEGNIEVFNNNQGLQLESLKTPNQDNVLHVNLATQEIFNFPELKIFSVVLASLIRFLNSEVLASLIRFLNSEVLAPLIRFLNSEVLASLIRFLNSFLTTIERKIKSDFIKKKPDFVEQILSKCPLLLFQTNAKGQTPLHVAAGYGHSAIVKLLINSCAKGRDGDFELGMDQVRAVREMLRIRDQESNTALHEAAGCGNVEVVKSLLEFEDPDFPYSANKKQETPLYIAAKRRDGGVLKVILENSRSTSHGGPHGRTALHAAAMAGDSEAIRVILETRGNLTKERDEDGYTPLHYAAHLGYISVVEEVLKWDVSAAYIGDKKRGMTPLLMAARQGHFKTVSKIHSLCPDCCEKVDNKGLSLLHYLAFRGSSSLIQSSFFKYYPYLKYGSTEIVYGSFRNLIKLEGAFGMTPKEVYNALRSEKHHHKQKQIKELLEEIENDQVAEEPVCRFPIQNVSTESLEKQREAHLIVAALIATVAFAAAITVPGGLQSEKGSEQGTPLLIHEAAFKAFVVTNALAFALSVSALTAHFGVLDTLFSRFKFYRQAVLYRTQLVSGILGYATLAMVIAFSTGSYVVLKPSHRLAIVPWLIGPAILLYICGILNPSIHMEI